MVQLVWFPAVILLLISGFKIQKVREERKVYVVDDHGCYEGRANTLYWLLPACRLRAKAWLTDLRKPSQQKACWTLQITSCRREKKKNTSHLQHTRTNQFLNSPVSYLVPIILLIGLYEKGKWRATGSLILQLGDKNYLNLWRSELISNKMYQVVKVVTRGRQAR